MLKVTVLYGHPASPESFETYYSQTHFPLVAKVQGITKSDTQNFCLMLTELPQHTTAWRNFIFPGPVKCSRRWALRKVSQWLEIYPILPPVV